MAPSITDIHDLLRHDEQRPLIMTLTATRLAAGKMSFGSGYVVGETMIFLVNSEGIEIRRNRHSLHVLRNDRDILRRNRRHCWIFENFDDRFDPPVRLNPRSFICPSALAWILQEHSLSEALTHHLRAEMVSEGEIAGRPTWVLREKPTAGEQDPSRLVSLEIDQDHGVILAVKTGQERLEATEFSFPDSLPNPSWDGLWEPFQRPDSIPSPAPDVAEIPGYIKSLPPQFVDPRRLRVFVSEIELEGAFPDYHQGQSVRLTLGFSSLPAPLEGMTTRRRGLVRNLREEVRLDAEGMPQWPIMLIGDGWTALAYTPIPRHGEAEIQGWFHYSAYGIVGVPTDLRIERIFASIGTMGSDERLWQEVDNTSLDYSSEKWWISDVVLDVTLDGAVPPPLRHDIFNVCDPVVSGHHLWLRDVSLPVARCWETTTGRYLGQTLVPAPLRDRFPVVELHTDPQLGAVAAIGENGWILTPGQVVASKATHWTSPTQLTLTDPPQVPSPWEVVAVRGDGLFELQSLAETSRRTALGRVNDNGGIDIGELSPSDYIIDSVMQIGDEYIVGRRVEEFRLNVDLGIISRKELDIDEPGWESNGQVAYLREGTHISFFDRASGDELTSVDIAEGHHGMVLSASGLETIVLFYYRNPNHSMSIIPTVVANYDNGNWTTIPLEEAPAEMF